MFFISPWGIPAHNFFCVCVACLVCILFISEAIAFEWDWLHQVQPSARLRRSAGLLWLIDGDRFSARLCAFYGRPIGVDHFE